SAAAAILYQIRRYPWRHQDQDGGVDELSGRSARQFRILPDGWRETGRMENAGHTGDVVPARLYRIDGAADARGRGLDRKAGQLRRGRHSYDGLRRGGL